MGEKISFISPRSSLSSSSLFLSLVVVVMYMLLPALVRLIRFLLLLGWFCRCFDCFFAFESKLCVAPSFCARFSLSLSFVKYFRFVNLEYCTLLLWIMTTAGSLGDHSVCDTQLNRNSCGRNRIYMVEALVAKEIESGSSGADSFRVPANS